MEIRRDGLKKLVMRDWWDCRNVEKNKENDENKLKFDEFIKKNKNE